MTEAGLISAGIRDRLYYPQAGGADQQLRGDVRNRRQSIQEETPEGIATHSVHFSLFFNLTLDAATEEAGSLLLATDVLF